MGDAAHPLVRLPATGDHIIRPVFDGHIKTAVTKCDLIPLPVLSQTDTQMDGQMDTRTDRQAVSSIPPKIIVLPGYN